MRKSIPVPDGFIERVGIHSGVIRHKQKGVEYGVIFTANGSQRDYETGKFERPTASDFNKEELRGALLENVDAAQQNEPDRFFKILGGYFWDEETDTTKEVFGIATADDFGIAEGSAVTLNDNFTLLDPDKPKLDERNEGFGWTFIVEPKKREKFPQSHRPLKLYVDCPVIDNIDITYGDCDEQNRRKVTFVPSVSGGEIRSHTWDLGDGHTNSGDGSPQAIDHYFAEKPSKPVKLTVTGNPACESVSREKALDDFTPCKKPVDPPKVKNIDITYGECNQQNQRKVTFVPSVSAGEIKSHTWDFGDGHIETGSGPPQAVDHYFAEKPGKPVKLTITGPPPLQPFSFEKALDGFTPCEKQAVCPELVRIDHVLAEKDETTQKVDFTAVFEKGTPENIEWTFGDGSAPVRSDKHTISHRYKRVRGGMLNFTVRAESYGPGECTAAHEKNIGVPGISVAGLCAYWPFIIAFLSALLVGTCTVQWCVSVAGELLDLPPSPWLLPLLIVLFVVTAIAIFLWYRQCDPGKCDWMAIAWVTVLSVMLVLFYINPCCSTWLTAVLALIGGGIVLALWVVRCKPAVISLLVFFVICVITAAIGSYVIAASALAGCL